MLQVNWRDIDPKHPQPGVTTQRFDSNGMTIVRYQFEPQASFPIHSHPEEQVVIVLQGQVAFTVADQTLHLGPGDVCHVDPHVPHGAQVGDEPVAFLNLLSPRRTVDNIAFHGP